jgi:predicted signal transduction protein with EAL and GGDEF domain
MEIAEIVRAACAANRFESEGVAPQITLSIGVAAQAPWGANPRALLSRADAALYQAKREGRNRVVAAAANLRSIAPSPAKPEEGRPSGALCGRGRRNTMTRPPP